MITQIEIINKETMHSVERVDISHLQSDRARQIYLTIFKGKFDDKFLMEHTIEINNGYVPEQEEDNPIKERIGNIIELNNFYH